MKPFRSGGEFTNPGVSRFVPYYLNDMCKLDVGIVFSTPASITLSGHSSDLSRYAVASARGISVHQTMLTTSNLLASSSRI
jgi:hypothetical protein